MRFSLSVLVDHSHWTNGYTDSITPFPGIHTTDVTQSKALAMIDHAADSKEQFFMMVAPGMQQLHVSSLHSQTVD